MIKKILIFLSLAYLFIGCPDDDDCPTCPQPRDTTSHEFVFELDTLGDGNGTSLYDIAIVNDTLAYAVGEIFLRDSTGEFETEAYNLAQWDGKRWKLSRVPTAAFGGLIGHYPIKTIIAFNSEDVWTFSTAGSYSHWNGISWETRYVPERSGGGTKFWGTSSSNLYLVGSNGSITHYNGTTWQKIESGTTLPINDIWGARNETTGEWEVIAIASNFSTDQGKRLLRINSNNTVTALPDSGLPWSINGVWFAQGKSYYVVGDGLYNLPTLGPIWSRDNITPYYKTSVRGNHENDVFVSGTTLLMHYNGKSWKKYYEGTGVPFGNVEIRGNFMLAEGTANNRGLIVRGYRK